MERHKYYHLCRKGRGSGVRSREKAPKQERGRDQRSEDGGSFTVHSNEINLTWKISSTTTEHCDLEESQILNFVLNNFVVFLNNIVTISIVVVVGRSENSWILTSDMFPLKFTLKRSVNYSNCCWLLIYIHWTNLLINYSSQPSLEDQSAPKKVVFSVRLSLWAFLLNHRRRQSFHGCNIAVCHMGPELPDQVW